MANLILGFIMDVIIFMGAAVGTAIATTSATTGQAKMPPMVAFLACLCVAVVQAGRRWDSKRSASPVKTDPVVALRTPAQLEAEGRAKEDEAAALRDSVADLVKQTLAVAKATEPPAATPAPVSNTNVVPTAPPPPVVSGPGVTRIPRERDLPGGSA
jgi:hypothetical protein